jgi:ABC-2 type transport system permease protein
MKEFLQKTWAIAWKNLQVLFKDRGGVAILFLLPLLFSSLLAMAYGSAGGDEETSIHLDTYLVNEDEGPYGEMVVAALREMPVLRIVEISSAQTADEFVGEGEKLAAVVIPADFSDRIEAYDPTAVEVVIDPLQEEYAGHVTGLVNFAVAPPLVLGEVRYAIETLLDESGMLDEADPALRQAVEAQMVGAMMTQVQEMENDPLITVENVVESEETTEESFNPVVVIVPGFTVMFAFFLIGVIAESLHAERDQGTFRRLLAAPLDRGSIIGGTMIAFMMVVFMQVIFLFGIAAGIFNMPLGNSIPGLLLITLALSLAATSLGLLLGSVTKTGKQAGAIGLVLGFVLAGLGGALLSFRVYESEGILGMVGLLTPHAHALEGYNRIMVDGLGVAAVWPQALILLGFALIFFLGAMWLLKFD